MIYEAAAKIGKIELVKRRLEGQARHASRRGQPAKSLPMPPSHPDAVELPGEDVPSYMSASPHHTPRSSIVDPLYPYHDTVSSEEKFVVLPSDDYRPRLSSELPNRYSGEYNLGSPNNISPRRSGEHYGRPEAPPIPPKTPIQGEGGNLRPPQTLMIGAGNPRLPYPDFDGPPPFQVNKLRKPQYNPG